MALAILIFLLTPAISAAIPFHFAQAKAVNWVGQGFGTENDACKKDGVVSAGCYSANQFYYHLTAAGCSIATHMGPDGCTEDPEIFQQQLKASALGNIAMGIDFMYKNPPADLAYWARDTGMALGFVPRQAYAQGIGFSGLAPLLPIWKAFRNIAYILLAFAMVVVGFMVMMRKKIDPKTVVTVQNALPRIVMALILITFSYAIVGLLIDLMYVLIALVNVLISSALPALPVSEKISNVGIPENFVNMGFWGFLWATFYPTKLLPATLLPQIPGDISAGNWGQVVWDILGGTLFTATGLGSLFWFLILLAYLFAFVKLLFMLINSYIQILLAVLTGPLQILVDVFPGANGFTSWLNNIVANLAVFPITIFMLMIGNVIGQRIGYETMWVPPLLPQGVDFGGLAEGLITLGIILATPGIANGLKETLKAKSPIEAGPGAIFGPIGRAGGTLLNTAFQFSMIGNFVGGLRGGHDNKK
jgi:hypothetical protein